MVSFGELSLAVGVKSEFGYKKAGIKVQLFLFMIMIVVKFMNHFPNREMCYQRRRVPCSSMQMEHGG